MAFPGELSKAGWKGRKVYTGTGCIANPKLGVNISPFDQVLLKCKVELQILQVTAIKEALGLYQGSDVHFSSIYSVNVSVLNILELWISSCPETWSGTSS